MADKGVVNASTVVGNILTRTVSGEKKMWRKTKQNKTNNNKKQWFIYTLKLSDTGVYRLTTEPMFIQDRTQSFDLETGSKYKQRRTHICMLASK